MNPEKFNPNSPEYMEVKDLPKNQQENFADVSDGFVRKEVLENQARHEKDAKEINSVRSSIYKLFGRNKVSVSDNLHTEALSEDADVSFSGNDHEFSGKRYGELLNLYPEIGPVLRELSDSNLSEKEFFRIIDEFNNKYGMAEKAGLHKTYNTPAGSVPIAVDYFTEGNRRVRIRSQHHPSDY